MEVIIRVILGFISGILEIIIRDIIFGFFEILLSLLKKLFKAILEIKIKKNH